MSVLVDCPQQQGQKDASLKELSTSQTEEEDESSFLPELHDPSSPWPGCTVHTDTKRLFAYTHWHAGALLHKTREQTHKHTHTHTIYTHSQEVTASFDSNRKHTSDI